MSQRSGLINIHATCSYKYQVVLYASIIKVPSCMHLHVNQTWGGDMFSACTGIVLRLSLLGVIIISNL